MSSPCCETSDPSTWDSSPVLSLPFPIQEVLTATLDLEDVRSYRAEISSRNLEVSALGNTSLSAQPGPASGPVCCGLDQGCGARDGAEPWLLSCARLLSLCMASLGSTCSCHCVLVSSPTRQAG